MKVLSILECSAVTEAALINSLLSVTYSLLKRYVEYRQRAEALSEANNLFKTNLCIVSGLKS